MIRGIIMDNDGVLVDTEDLKLDALNSILQRHSAKIAKGQYYGKYVGRGEVDVVTSLIESHRIPTDVQELLELKRAAYYNMMMEQRDYLLMPFVPVFLETMQKWNIPVVIATGSTKKEMQVLLPLIGTDFIKTIVTQEDVPVQKPDPEMFLLAAEKLGLPPEQVMIVEDNLMALQNAKQYGFTTVLINRHKSGNFNGVDYHFNSLGEFDYELLRR